MATPDAQLLVALQSPAVTALPPTATDADVLAVINAPTVTRVPFYATARTLYGIDPTQAKAALNAVQLSDANLYKILLMVGPTDGSSGGVEVSLPATIAQVNGLAAAGVITADFAATLLAMGATTTYPAGSLRTLAEVTNARAYLAAQAVAAAARASAAHKLAAGTVAVQAAVDAAATAGTPLADDAAVSAFSAAWRGAA